ncbi:DUF2399 domain-containing protein [Pseudonocardia sichuanensis]
MLGRDTGSRTGPARRTRVTTASTYFALSAGDAGAAATAVVCTSGQPALVVLDVLAALRGAELRYHGDFDWAGVAIANRLRAMAGVRPWRMRGADYERGLAGATLPAKVSRRCSPAGRRRRTGCPSRGSRRAARTSAC